MAAKGWRSGTTMKQKEKKQMQQEERPALRITRLREGQCLIEVGKMAHRNEEGEFSGNIPVYRMASVEEVVALYEQMQERRGTLTEKATQIFKEELIKFLAMGGAV